ncbi:hypothetical protein SteCoe_12734 [Stentor coeruleus]|uniref:RING-type domain-containing protein n=1 Tax=Stentor coeruleus TaxID=5963 RepID=A0A1R2CA27_9CILI|nr:hypothetical protein SteCoe_12734 [Stentor coeruleus]
MRANLIFKELIREANSYSSEEELPSTQQMYDIQTENSCYYNKPQVYPLRPAKKSSKCCPQCKQKFNSMTNLPFLLPSCGHTFCKFCLQKMSCKTFIRCGLCNSMTYKELKKLPVNYALIEAFESSNKKPKCKEHNSEIMAYCCNEDSLLCGSCTFMHRTHEVYLLTDPKIQSIANSKKNYLKNQEHELCELKTEWEKAKEELQQGLKELKMSADKHKEELSDTENKIIQEIKMGSGCCVHEIRKIEDNEDYMQLKNKIRDNIIRISDRLESICEMKEQFDILPIVDKLKKTLKSEVVDYDLPPSLSPAHKVVEKLKSSIEYERSIKNYNLSIV